MTTLNRIGSDGEAISASPQRAGLRPYWTTGLIAVGDGLAVVLALAVGRAIVAPLWAGAVEVAFLPEAGMIVLAMLVAFVHAGLYPGVGLNPVDELRRTFVALAAAHAIAGIALVGWSGGGGVAVPLAVGGVVSLGLVPAVRLLVRGLGSRFPWWGYPALVVGEREACRQALRMLQWWPKLGLRPVAVVSEDVPAKHLRRTAVGETLAETYVEGPVSSVSAVPRSVAEPPESAESGARLHVRFHPDFFGFSGPTIARHDLTILVGSPTVESRGRFRHAVEEVVKRCFDVAVAGLALVVLLPLYLLIAMAIKIDSPGPIFYGQRRPGKGGKRFKLWKFRSMVNDAESVLDRHLAADPELRRQWEEGRKLKNDPRITRVGAWLRMSSLDELPQLWNVIRGDMSLVGPRPIVDDDEVDKYLTYGDGYGYYTSVRPGLSGLWQVCGRSDTTYGERVILDRFYARHRSFCLDLYLLMRTLPVVLRKIGVY